MKFAIVMAVTMTATLVSTAMAEAKSVVAAKCRAGQVYTSKRCGGSLKTVPSYCLDKGKVAQGYFIRRGKCDQNNGGGE
jgi:hypothetical protein